MIRAYVASMTLRRRPASAPAVLATAALMLAAACTSSTPAPRRTTPGGSGPAARSGSAGSGSAGSGRAALLVVHGGGWTGGDRGKFDDVADELARSGFVAVNADYTLATKTEPGYPRQPEELRAAVTWIRKHAGDYGVDPQRVGALGGSAGAHLVALLGTDGNGSCTAGERVAAVVAWSAPLDLVSLEQVVEACTGARCARGRRSRPSSAARRWTPARIGIVRPRPSGT